MYYGGMYCSTVGTHHALLPGKHINAMQYVVFAILSLNGRILNLKSTVPPLGFC